MPDTNERDDEVLVLLRRVEGRLDDMQTDLRKIRKSLGSLEVVCASVSRQVDRIDGRLERIERRLDLVDVTT